jgi:prephenate dehydrogenase
MTRLALSSYDLWRDILATNSEHIDRALAAYIQELEHIRENLRTRQLQEEFRQGGAAAARLREQK